MQNFKLNFQTVTEKTTKNFRGLLCFAPLGVCEKCTLKLLKNPAFSNLAYFNISIYCVSGYKHCE